MAVPAGDVLSWLGSVELEQVGSLPTDGAADPVFTVSTPELRADLAARLAAIGKTEVVLAPERVRAFHLLRNTGESSRPVKLVRGTAEGMRFPRNLVVK